MSGRQLPPIENDVLNGRIGSEPREGDGPAYSLFLLAETDHATILDEQC